MQSFQMASSFPAGQKNYVFVDEHNRHKRLKVMRACEGCRRRKIKCDSATTNTWPCAACTRLKLHCIPPTTGNENDPPENSLFIESDENRESNNTVQTASEKTLYFNGTQHFSTSSSFDSYQSSAGYSQVDTNYQKMAYSHAENFNPGFRQAHQASVSSEDSYGTVTSMYQSEQLPTGIPRIDTSSTSEIEYSVAENLSEQLGELKIGENGVAPYLRQQNKYEAESDAPIQEIEIKLPALNTGAGSQIRIPPALMPSDEDSLHYFQIFFRDIHPYVPVINRNYFYHQWHSNRSAISPLVLEAIFACAGRMSDDPAGGAQWLALGNRHEECFLDKPRLSTLQALLLLLKAREGSPKRGYYYRSWMTCKTLVSMAKDLELHEHHETHKSGEGCDSEPVDCLTKTRIWQTLLVCEMMIGGPQGRSDMGVDPTTVDISPNPPYSDIDDFEKSLSRQFAYFVRNAYNIRLITDSSQKLKKKKDWGLDPEFVAYNVAFKKWPDELPMDLQLTLPSDGSPPPLSSHFIGNMHCHYQLGIVMLHRPQLLASKSFATDNAWKQQMSLCYNSAKLLCRLQEAILDRFGLTGLLCMQRGINFTIYAILTCTMIHLIAMTSPDPEFNADAREFFTRHIRLLEICTSSWPLPETEAQINALRAAFSADTNKPFELKNSFPYGSPTPDPYQSSPPPNTSMNPLLGHPNSQYPAPQPTHLSASTYIPTPPLSTKANDSKPESPQFHPDFVTQLPPASYQHQNALLDNTQWNPTPIIHQFNTAFAIPSSALAPPHPPTSHAHSSPSVMFQSQALSSQMYPATYPSTSYPHHYLQQHPHHQDDMHVPPLPQQQLPQPSQAQQTNYPAPAPVYVGAQDWQKTVASVVDPGGLKRRWAYVSHNIDEHVQKRMK